LAHRRNLCAYSRRITTRSTPTRKARRCLARG
jgi:hypothetical protein